MKLNMILAIAFGLAMVAEAKAQSDDKWVVGIKPSYNINSANFPDGVFPVSKASGTEASKKFSAGVFIERRISTQFSVIFEVNYRQFEAKGSETVPSDGNNVNSAGKQDGALTMNYISLPLFAEVAFGHNAIQPFITAGLTFDIPVGDKQVYYHFTAANPSPFYPQQNDYSTKTTDFTREGSLGIGFGGGIKAAFGSRSQLRLQARLLYSEQQTEGIFTNKQTLAGLNVSRSKINLATTEFSVAYGFSF